MIRGHRAGRRQAEGADPRAGRLEAAGPAEEGEDGPVPQVERVREAADVRAPFRTECRRQKRRGHARRVPRAPRDGGAQPDAPQRAQHSGDAPRKREAACIRRAHQRKRAEGKHGHLGGGQHHLLEWLEATRARAARRACRLHSAGLGLGGSGLLCCQRQAFQVNVDHARQHRGCTEVRGVRSPSFVPSRRLWRRGRRRSAIEPSRQLDLHGGGRLAPRLAA